MSTIDLPAFAEKSPTSPDIEGKPVTLRISDTEIKMVQRGSEASTARTAFPPTLLVNLKI